MATRKQLRAAKKNIKKAQRKWRLMSKKARSHAQPEGRKRAKPGSTGEGDYFHIEVRRKEQFSSFRVQDVGDPGHIQRVAGHRKSGSWATQKWLVSKKDAEKEGDTLKPKNQDVEDLFLQLGSKPKHVKGDIYKAKPRPNVPEADKPTPAQKKARQENIKKAQEAQRK